MNSLYCFCNSLLSLKLQYKLLKYFLKRVGIDLTTWFISFHRTVVMTFYIFMVLSVVWLLIWRKYFKFKSADVKEIWQKISVPFLVLHVYKKECLVMIQKMLGFSVSCFQRVILQVSEKKLLTYNGIRIRAYITWIILSELSLMNKWFLFLPIL